jgi:hypothetical protein
MKTQRPATEILEQAVNLLRAAPPQAIVIYLAGAIPFMLGVLVFLNDMMLSAFAFDHLVEASLGLAALYLWKNTLQAVFAARLYQTLSPEQTRSVRFFRALVVQGTLQPVGLALPLPLPWLVAFFRNVALFAAIGDPHPARTARRQAVLWTRQTWAVLAFMTLAFLMLFANVLIAIVLLPQLARSFLGIEGDFARLGSGLLNTTTLAVALGLSWLVIDPVLDAVFVLRCFYGESIATGEDLRASLSKALSNALRKGAAIAVLLFSITFLAPRPGLAQTTSQQMPVEQTEYAQSQAKPPAQTIDPAQLDRSIDAVIHRREFAWRSPHSGGEEPHGKWVGWVRSAMDMVRRVRHAAWELIRKWFGGEDEREARSADAPVSRRMLETMTGLIVALIVGAAIVFFLRRRAPAVKAVAVTSAAPAVNLADESLTADQLPESSWLQLAEEWLAKGDCRLALRALHLAGLKYLGERNLVSIRRWKSGLDYRREVERRARAHPEISPEFSKNVALFERGWYGTRGVDREMVEAFAARLTEIRNHAG